MIAWKKLLLSPDDTMQRALEVLNEAGTQLVLVADESLRLLGVVTDGDIRRKLVAGGRVESRLRDIMQTKPVTVPSHLQANVVLPLMQDNDFTHIPIVNEKGILVGLWSRKKLESHKPLTCPVVFMAGGLGSRLGELTRDCPKPLLKVGGKPVLEIALETFRECGFRNFFIAVNHHAAMIEEYFGDGARWGASIAYLREKTRLGTAGPLSLLPPVDEPVIVINGDILTRFNPRLLFEQHRMNRSAATMVVKQHDISVPYGVVHSTENGELARIEEKPVLSFLISAGINVFSPEVLQCIPPDTYFDIPELYAAIHNREMTVKVYSIDDYWVDIGRVDDYYKADSDARDTR